MQTNLRQVYIEARDVNGKRLQAWTVCVPLEEPGERHWEVYEDDGHGNGDVTGFNGVTLGDALRQVGEAIDSADQN